MATPAELAKELLAKPKAERLEETIKLFEMIQSAIVIRSSCRDKFFVSMSGKEDSGTKFDRLLKELFGMEWKA